MILIICLVLALVPLLGIGWVVISGAIFTVDGLFMSLILLAISGILLLNALLELKKGKGSETASSAGPVPSVSGGLVQKGRVESVQFYESHVGQPNKSIVTMSGSGNGSRTLVFDGDVRNALPVGQKVEVTFRKHGESNVLVNVS